MPPMGLPSRAIPPLWVTGGRLPINMRWRNGLGTEGKIIGAIMPEEFNGDWESFCTIHGQGRLMWELYSAGLIWNLEVYQEPTRWRHVVQGELTDTGLAYRKVLAVKATVEINEFPRYEVSVDVSEFDPSDSSVMGMEARASNGPAINIGLDNLSEAQAAEIFRRLAGLPGMPSAEEFEDTTNPLEGLPAAFKRRLDLE